MEVRFRNPTAVESSMIGPEVPVEDHKPSWIDVGAATVRQHNPAAAWMDSLYYKAEFEDVEGYNPYEDLPEKYLQFSEVFQDVQSPRERDFKINYIESQLSDREKVAKGGARMIPWALVAGIGDPFTLPLMAVPAAKAGQTAAKTAAITASVGMAETAASEMYLHSLQPTRTWQESMYAIGGVGVLGFTLGGVAGISARNMTKALDDADKYVREAIENGGLEELPEGSVGAMRAGTIGTLEEEGSEFLGPGINPLVRALKSPFAATRNLMNNLAEHNFYIGKNKAGQASDVPLETEVKLMRDGMTYKFVTHMQDAYKKMTKSMTMTGARISGRMSGMRFSQFAEEIGKAMRRGDEHVIPEVAEAARKIRQDVINPITKGFQGLGDLAEDLKPAFAKSYLPRLYDPKAIEENLDQWIDLLSTHFQKKGMDAAEAKTFSHQVTNNIMGTHAGFLQKDIVPASKHLKKRVLDLPDEALEPYMVSNVDQVMQAYMRSTVPELQIRTRLPGKNLNDSIDSAIENIRIEADSQLEKATPKQRKALQKAITRDTADIRATFDILLGRYMLPVAEHKKFSNLANTFRGLSFMANMGMMTIAAVPDVARPMMQHGFMAYAKALPASFLTFASKRSRIAQNELKSLGIALDVINNSRLYAMSEVTEIGTRMEKWTRRFSKYSGMNHWNTHMKLFSAMVSQNRFIDDAIRYSKLSARKTERLAKAGIDEAMAARIAAQAQEHGEKISGSWHASTTKWTDREAADLFDRVLLRDVDNTIVTPGIADKPLFMSTQMGKTVMQFKSFFLAAHNQVLIPAMQQMARGDAAALQGMATAVSLGMMVEWIRMQTSGRSEELEDYGAADWLRAGIDRSGIATLPMEVVNILDRAAEGRISRAVGMQEGSRYFYRNLGGSFLGPVAGYADDAIGTFQNLAAEGEMTASDVHTLRKLMPYQNLFYTRDLLTKIEEYAVDELNLEDNRRKR